MARNEEKANFMMNKWVTMKEEMRKGEFRTGPTRRPYLASECKTLGEAERWRKDVIKDITTKISEIQNTGLGEARTRELNDEINKHLREKYHWEKQIKALGGPDYSISAVVLDEDGKEALGGRGYRYFGAAKELPGVKELLADTSSTVVRRTRGEIAKHLTPDYYGYRDEEDLELLAAEAKRTEQLKAEISFRWKEQKEERDKLLSSQAKGGYVNPSAALDSPQTQPLTNITSTEQKGGMSLNSAAALLAQKKKQLLLQKYNQGSNE